MSSSSGKTVDILDVYHNDQRHHGRESWAWCWCRFWLPERDIMDRPCPSV